MCLDLCLSPPNMGLWVLMGCAPDGQTVSSLVGSYALSPGGGATVSCPDPCAPPSPLSTAGGGGRVAMRQESSRVLRSRAARAGSLTSPGGTMIYLTLCTTRATGVGLIATRS